MILDKNTYLSLSRKLLLPYTGSEQDWDIEMADSTRLGEFIRYFSKNNLNEEEKFGLMSLVLASYDDYLNEHNLNVDKNWTEIKYILKQDKILYFDLLDYWALVNEPDYKDLFRITPLIREFLNS